MKKGEGAWRFGGLPQRFFWYILTNLGDFLKEFGENRRLLPLSILDFTNLCADRGLEVGLADLLCPSGGGGGWCERTQRTLPAYGPVVSYPSKQLGPTLAQC